jgi:hypothetical protein
VPREQHLQHNGDSFLAGERSAIAIGVASLHKSADEVVARALDFRLDQGRGIAPEGRQFARRIDLLVLAGSPEEHRAAVVGTSLDPG